MTKTFEKVKASSLFHGVFPFEFDDSVSDGNLPNMIHLVPIGSWDHDIYGPIIIGAADIQQFVKNFDAKIRKGVFITAGHEGATELPAQGWITRVLARDTGLWGVVEWNALGKETLTDKQYKFFSPEFYLEYADPETHEVYQNVLTGGALTKSPYFKELEAVVFSDKNINTQFNDHHMNLKDLLKKKPSELTKEEKDFIKKNKEKMSDSEKETMKEVFADADEEEEEADEKDEDKEEKKKAKEAKEKKEADDALEAANLAKGLNADGSTKIVADDKGMVHITAAEYKVLSNKANEGASAFAELQKAKLDTAVSALIFNEKTNTAGKLLPKAEVTLREFMAKLSDEQRKQFSDIFAHVVEKSIFKEAGDTGSQTTGTVQAEVDAKVTALQASDTTLKYSDAVRKVFAEDGGLYKRYNDEIHAIQG